MIAFIQAHPTVTALVTYYFCSAFIGALPAPTATSGMFYQFVYKFLNTFGGNLTRAFATRVEKSPNFQDAVAVQNGQTPTPKLP